MNARLYQFLYNKVAMLTLVDLQILVGSSGAVTSFSGNLIKSVVHTSTGLYTITLTDSFNAFIAASGAMVSPSGSLSGIVALEIGNGANASVQTAPGTIVIQTLSDSDAVADPASGSIVSAIILLRNSSVPY